MASVARLAIHVHSIFTATLVYILYANSAGTEAEVAEGTEGSCMRGSMKRSLSKLVTSLKLPLIK